MSRLGRSRLALTVILAVAFGSCMPPEEPVFAPEPFLKGPDVRIGLILDGSSAKVGGGGALRVVDPDEGPIAELPRAETGVLARSRAGVALRGSFTDPRRADVSRRRLLIEPADGETTVRLGGREYRGVLEIDQGSSGIRVINRVDLEQYLVGVVGAEMGNRAPEEVEALKAQAVASRTYALRHQGAGGDRGYDMLADENNQVYAGLALEQPLAGGAVAATRGEILTWQGAPIDAFFSSTCGGETEDGPAAFPGAVRPYLAPVSDRDPAGVAWCAISPRYRWEESWSVAEIAAVLRRTLAGNGLPTARAADLTDLRIVDRTGTGRVATLELAGRRGRTAVSGQAIRRVLAPVGGGILRSTDFAIRLDRRGGRIERLTIEGRGNGHAVGMCQYGAIGRARAGQDYLTILGGYFPGTTLTKRY